MQKKHLGNRPTLITKTKFKYLPENIASSVLELLEKTSQVLTCKSDK